MKIEEMLAIMKPRWKFAAMDRNGLWHVFERKPRVKVNGKWFDNVYGSKMAINRCLFEVESFEGNWEESLVERSEVK